MKNFIYKKWIFFLLITTLSQYSKGQQIYCDFEGVKILTFGPFTGTLDSLALNPAKNSIDTSAHCAKYIRDTVHYDNFKIYPDAMMVDITPFAVNSPNAPKIKMKLYSNVPVGTIVRLQLGSKSDNTYPAGIHSEYWTTTSVKNAWQNLIFNYLQSTPGSLVLPTNIDKMILFFDPNSSNRDTIYFDDIMGPNLITTSGIPSIDESPAFKLSQNNPNPAKENTHINFQLKTSGYVSLKVYDMLGNLIVSVLDQNMKTGNYSVPVETSSIPNGIYFYVLKKEDDSQTMKMIISK